MPAIEMRYGALRVRNGAVNVRADTAAALAAIPAGAFLHLRPEGIQFTGTTVTGWRNEITGAIIPCGGTYNPSDPAFNGKPSVTWAGSGYPDAIAAGTNPGLSFFLVGKREPGHNNSMWFWLAPSGQLGYNFINVNDAAIGWNSYSSSYIPYTGTSAELTGKLLLAGSILSGTTTDDQSATPPNPQIWLNGSRKTPSNTQALAARVTGGDFYVGRYPSDPSTRLYGSLCEIVVYPSILPMMSFASGNSFLKNKYAIS